MDAVIETPRLILRHFTAEDLDALAELMANPDFMRFSSGVFTREQAANFLFDRDCPIGIADSAWPDYARPK